MINKNNLIFSGSFQPQFYTRLSMVPDIAGKGDGIYAYYFSEETGELSSARKYHGITNPAKFCIDASGTNIYAASDTNEFLNWEAGTGGGVYAFKLQSDGSLKMKDMRSSCGVRAVDICCDQTGKYVVVINSASVFCTTEFVKNSAGRYVANIRRDEGCAVLFRVGEAGFEKVCDRYVLPEGTPAHPNILTLDDRGCLFIGNKGGGSVSVLKLCPETESLRPISTVTLGKGPDGLALHPVLPVFYVTDTFGGELKVYQFDEERKNFRILQRIVDEDPSNPSQLIINQAGDLLYAFDGRRGEVKVFGISQEGKLVLVQRLAEAFDAGENDPIYGLAFSAAGKWLLATNIHKDEIYAYPVRADGTLGQPQVTFSPTPTGLLVV